MNTETQLDTSTEKACIKLITNLEELVKQYRQLLDCVRKEKELLLDAQNLEPLIENNQTKETHLTKIRAVDTLRMRYAQELCVLIKLDPQTPRLLEISTVLGGAYGEKLRNLHSTLDIVINRLILLNKENEALAQNGLKFVNGAVNTMKDALSGKKTYEKKGAYKLGPDHSGNFVNKQT